MENLFLASVADAKMYDIFNGDLIVNGTTETNTSMTQAMQSTPIYGGKGSQKLLDYNYQKELSFAVEDAAFNVAYLAMQNGTTVKSKLADYYTSEEVTVDASGVGTLEVEPIGTVHIQNKNGTFNQVIPTGKTFILPSIAGSTVTVVYTYKKDMDTLVIDASTFPKAVKLVLNVDIVSARGKVGELQIVVPQFKPDGALELSMTHDGVSTSAMAGTALATKGVLAELNINMVDQGEVSFTGLCVRQPEVVLDSTIAGDAVTITVIGHRSGVYGDMLVDNASLTWISDDTTIAEVLNGVITLGASAAPNDTVIVRVEDVDGNKDIVEVSII